MKLFIICKPILIVLTFLLSPMADANRGRRGNGGRSRRHLGGQVEDCTMPPLAELERLLYASVDIPPSFYQLPQLRESVMTLEKINENNTDDILINVKKSQFQVGNNTACQSSGPASDPCPMSWNFNYDENRIPETMVEGMCQNCTSCRLMSGSSSTLGCDPVEYYTKVLRRKRHCHPQTNNYVYVEVWEPITVGCACRTNSREESTPPRIHNPPNRR